MSEILLPADTRARVLANGLAALPGLDVDLSKVQTNMVFAGTRESGMPAAELIDRLAEQGVLALDEAHWSIRFVTHLDLDDADIEQAITNLPIDEETWKLAMDLARASRGSGLTIPCTDLVIGACARRHGATLLHRDSHLDQIPASSN